MKTLLLAAGVLAAGLNTPAFAEDAGAVKTALGETKPIFDLRLRSETVDQDGLANDAHATTLRARWASRPARSGIPRCSSKARGSFPSRTTTGPIP